MQIKSLKTKFDQEISLGRFTILVGPNNVGKSQTLRDIHSKIVERKPKTVIIDSLVLEKPYSFGKLIESFDIRDNPKNIDNQYVRGITSNLRAGEQIEVNLKGLEDQFEQQTNIDYTLGHFGKFFVSYLDAASRLLVAQSTGSHNPHENPPQNLLQGLYATEEETENKLINAFKETFGMEIKLDYSGLVRLCLRIAKEFKEIPKDPRKAYPIMNEFSRLDEQGDGFKSFVGVILSLLLSKGRIVLLDEPEAFLHPAQAKFLGRKIVQISRDISTQIIVATHNSNFLAGILSESSDIDIFRLNRTADRTEYVQLRPEATNKLVTSPLLSSQRVLEAIFYNGVVVCEADSDRSIYQTVATRIFSSQNFLFIHAHNKQMIKIVISLLKEAMIPVSAIVDIDILNSEDETRKLILSQIEENEFISEILSEREKVAQIIEEKTEDEVLSTLRRSINDLSEQIELNKHNLAGARGAINRIKKDASKWGEIKKSGIQILQGENLNLIKNLLNKLSSIGIFVVPVGELEGWIDVGTRKKQKWIVHALEVLHRDECPEELRSFIEAVLRFMGENFSD